MQNLTGRLKTGSYGSPKKKSYVGEVFYLEDQAESLQLSQNSLSEAEYFEQLVYRNLRGQFFYNLGLTFKEFHFETCGGARIPYAIQCNDYNLGFLPILEETPSRSEKAAAASFLKTYINSRVLFLNKGSKILKLDEKSIIAPVFYFI
jgi:hypothetical protein